MIRRLPRFSRPPRVPNTTITHNEIPTNKHLWIVNKVKIKLRSNRKEKKTVNMMD